MKRTLLMITVLALVAASAAAQMGMRDDSPQRAQQRTMDQAEAPDDTMDTEARQVRAEARTGARQVRQTVQARTMDRNISHVREMVEQRRQIAQRQLDELPAPRRMAVRNQNEVRMAVHALLAAENFTGGIGPQVSEIAREFNNSVQATIREEERIRDRGGFRRFLFGGDHLAAERMNEHAERNLERVQQLRQRLQECDGCGQEVRGFMQEQIQEIEEEQERLRGLAQAEKQSKGLLGWIWK